MTTTSETLTNIDVDALAVETLPDRAAMSLVNANLAAPINAALGLNVLSDNSAAMAGAQQTAPITQGI
jgi:predicted TIM-barrel enzyme